MVPVRKNTTNELRKTAGKRAGETKKVHKEQ